MPSSHLPRIEHEVTVMFYDTDCAAVVHNLAYLRFIEEARTIMAEKNGHAPAPNGRDRPLSGRPAH